MSSYIGRRFDVVPKVGALSVYLDSDRINFVIMCSGYIFSDYNLTTVVEISLKVLINLSFFLNRFYN